MTLEKTLEKKAKTDIPVKWLNNHIDVGIPNYVSGNSQYRFRYAGNRTH